MKVKYSERATYEMIFAVVSVQIRHMHAMPLVCITLPPPSALISFCRYLSLLPFLDFGL